MALISQLAKGAVANIVSYNELTLQPLLCADSLGEIRLLAYVKMSHTLVAVATFLWKKVANYFMSREKWKVIGSGAQSALNGDLFYTFQKNIYKANLQPTA